MFLEKLKQIIEKDRKDRPEYLRSILKMSLIEYILEYIYTSVTYRNLLFKGGTCLRICYELPRLSEDIDLDFIESVNINNLKDDLIQYFKRELAYDDIYASVTNNNQTITLKFPILRMLGVSNASESEILYVKLDIQKTSFSNTKPDLIPRQSYIIKAYPLPLLFTGKVNAIFTRDKKIGRENRSIPKGRDYFDLLWFLEKGIRPDLQELDKDLHIQADLEFKINLDRKVLTTFNAYKNDIINDLKPFIADNAALESFIESFIPLYEKLSLSIFDYRKPNENIKYNTITDSLISLINEKSLNGSNFENILQEIDTYRKGGTPINVVNSYEFITSRS